MRRTKFFLLAVFFSVILFSVKVYSEIRVLPLVNVDLYGGNSFFKGNSGSFSGNFNLDLVPVLRFNGKTSLLPRYSGKYTGASLAMEIEDEGYLYQQSQSHTGSLKLIQKIGRKMSLKAAGGYIKELLRETNDEKWTEGLYDYGSIYGEIETEKKFIDRDTPFLIGAGYRYYTMKFPNYKSLSSEKNIELIGENILDTDNNTVFVKADIYFTPGIFTRWRYSYNHSRYLDQKTVTSSGEYSTENRIDLFHTVKCALSYTLPDNEWSSAENKSYIGMNIKWKAKLSSQNHSDTDDFTFISGYYDYNQLKVQPVYTVRFIPSDIGISLAYEYSNKIYTDRPAQDEDGSYNDKKLYTTSNTVSLSVSYPLKPGLTASVSGNYTDISSNNKYEVYYSYTYYTANYLIGISYEY